MKDLKASLIKFNSITEKLNSVVKKFDNDSKISNVEEILLKENQNLKSVVMMVFNHLKFFQQF